VIRPYPDLPGLEHLYLEDSYVLDIEVRPGRVHLMLDLVLTADHPQHTDPLPGERYCYRRGELRFSAVTGLVWTGQGRPPAREPVLSLLGAGAGCCQRIRQQAGVLHRGELAAAVPRHALELLPAVRLHLQPDGLELEVDP